MLIEPAVLPRLRLRGTASVAGQPRAQNGKRARHSLLGHRVHSDKPDVENGTCESIQSYESVLCAHAQFRAGACVLLLFCEIPFVCESASPSSLKRLRTPLLQKIEESLFMSLPLPLPFPLPSPSRGADLSRRYPEAIDRFALTEPQACTRSRFAVQTIRGLTIMSHQS